MIVGRGLLAQAFARRGDDARLLVFASGVSNSGERDPAAFARERDALDAAIAQVPDARLVYFGSCGVASAEAETPYMAHKRAMEARVAERDGALVVRLPQVVGVTPNPHTLTNFLRDRILRDETFVVWSRAERNIVDVDDVAAITTALLREPAWTGGRVIPIAAERSTPMPDIVAVFERVLGRRARYTIEDRGAPFPLDTQVAARVARDIGVDLGPASTERILRKYYGHLAA